MVMAMTETAARVRHRHLRIAGLIQLCPPSIWLIAGLVVVSLALAPALLSPGFQWVILRQSAPIGFAICAQLLLMRCNSIDLSLGGVFLLTNYLTTSSLLSQMNPVLVVAVPLLAGMLIGAVNGFFIAVRRASSVVVTLAMGTILTGLVLYLSSGNPPGSAHSAVVWLGRDRVAGVPVAVMVWLGAMIVLALALRGLVYGRMVRAIGANPTAALISGLPVVRTFFISHVLAGLFAATGGLLQAGYIGMGSVRLGFDVVMVSIAGAILGGVTFGGGRRSILGAVAAAYALIFLINLMTTLRFAEPSKLIVQGLVIALAALFPNLSSRNRE